MAPPTCAEMKSKAKERTRRIRSRMPLVISIDATRKYLGPVSPSRPISVTASGTWANLLTPLPMKMNTAT